MGRPLENSKTTWLTKHRISLLEKGGERERERERERNLQNGLESLKEFLLAVRAMVIELEFNVKAQLGVDFEKNFLKRAEMVVVLHLPGEHLSIFSLPVQ